MRPIDADKLLEKYRLMLPDEPPEPGSFDEYGQSILCGAIAFLNIAQTIEVIPVKWLKEMLSKGKDGSLNNTSVEYVLEAWSIERNKHGRRKDL